MSGLAQSRYCSRTYKGAWGSGTAERNGRAEVEVPAATSARTRYVEVLQEDDGSWTRTLVFPPSLVEPPPATPYALMAEGATVLAVSLGLFAAPFVLCRRARRRAARVIELAR